MAAALVSACGGGSNGPSDSWAAPAIAYIEASTALLNDQGPLGTLPFYAEDAVLDARATQDQSALFMGIESMAASPFFGFTQGNVAWTRDPHVFVDLDGHAMTGTLRWQDGSVERNERYAVLRPAIGPLGIEHEINMGSTAVWRTWPWRRRPLSTEAEELAARWVLEWSNGGGGHPEAPLYAPTVEFEDSMANRSVRGPETIAALRQMQPETIWTLSSPVEEPSIYVYSTGASVTNERLDGAAFTVKGQRDGECPGEQLIWVATDEAGLITDERRFWDATDAERCLPADARPAGWWTSQPVPDPAAVPFEDLETTTGWVTLGDHSTAIRHGTPTLQNLVGWALSRFALAGMPLPEPVDITFTSFSDYCADVQGRSIPETDDDEVRWHVVLCMDEDSVCTGSGCDDYDLRAKRAVLHELAHVWLSANLTHQTEELFTEYRGLTAWDDQEQEWAERAREHAAEFIAWGLLDRPLALLEIRQPSPEARFTGFQILTGRKPLKSALESLE